MKFGPRFLTKTARGKSYASWFYLIENRTLLHESSNGEPQTVEDRELILHRVCVRITGVGVTPLVWGKAGDHKHHKAHTQVHSDDVDPHLCIQGRQEGEELRRFRFGFPEQDGYTDIPEGFGEIYHLFSFIRDRHSCHGQISSLQKNDIQSLVCGHFYVRLSFYFFNKINRFMESVVK